MKEFDIEGFLNGEISDDERQEIKKALTEDFTLQREVEVYQDVLDALKGQGIREQVTAALADSTPPPKGFSWKKWLFLVPLLVFAGWFLSKETPPQSPSPLPPAANSVPKKTVPTPPQSIKNDPIIPEKQDIKPSKKDAKKEEVPQNVPIAKTNSTTPLPQRIPPTNIRGKGEDTEAWDALLNSIWVNEFPLPNSEFSEQFEPTVQLLKEKDFNMAFVRLRLLERKMPKNDTVSFLKGYCLTELKEGQQALTYFDKMTTEPTDWSPAVEWYHALDYLLIGETEKAGELLNELSNAENHPYREASQKALEVLKSPDK